MKSDRAPHIYIVGQTASGKTGLSLSLADHFGSEILNTDSLMFYKDLSIGTAKPTKEELRTIKHHMVDVCDVGEDINAADYALKAAFILESSKKTFFCVGGSGFYIDALDKGLLPLPETDPLVIEKVNEIRDPVLELESVDPESFNSIAKEDLYRVKRALQVFHQTKIPLSQWKSENILHPYAKKIALHLERDELLKRVTKRTDLMLKDSGLIDEVREVVKNPKSTPWRPLGSVGYKQTLEYLNGDIESLEELKEKIVTKTMQLAKRQKTWFKKDKTVKWFSGDQPLLEIKEYILKLWETDKWRV